MPSKKVTINGNAAVNDLATVEIKPARNSKEKNQKSVIKKEIAQQLSGDFNARELLRVLTEVKNGNFSVHQNRVLAHSFPSLHRQIKKTSYSLTHHFLLARVCFLLRDE